LRNEDTKHLRTLKIPLKNPDRVQRAERMSLLDQQQEQLETEKKLTAAYHKDEIAKRVGERRALAQEYRQGFRWAEVECMNEKDLVKGTMVVIRLDTGEEVSTRDLTTKEKQGYLEL